MSVDFYETKDVNHGRTEYRRYWTTDNIDKICGTESWKGLNIVGMVENEKTAKIGVRNKRLKAGWDNSYLARLLIGNIF
jgi:hypothetical protein